MPALSSSTSFFFLLLLTYANGRRLLQDPFFSAANPPPAEAPPPNASPVPKYPFSSTSQPFFPEYPSPSPPPPSASNQPTFPANISSLIFPNSHSAPPRSRYSSGKIAAAILLPLLALSLLSLSLALFLRRRGRRHSTATEKACFFPRNYSSSSDDGGGGDVAGRKPPAAPRASEFLYVGTFSGSLGPAGDDSTDSGNGGGSPELHPLPPLSRQFRQNYGNSEDRCSSEEEFYSPRGSSSQKEFAPAAMERIGSRSETLSTTPSYPSSNSESSSPLGCSPEKSTAKSVSSRSNGGACGVVGFIPPPALIPQTAAPPPVSSPREQNSIAPSSSAADPQSPVRDREVSANLFAAGPGPAHRKNPAPPPPPPPPPPRAGYWENKVRSPQLSQPPCIASPNPIKLNNCIAPDSHVEKQERNCESVEKNEETPRPKLKPLHWDKVRASSDRAMAWDQLSSSSFQVNEEMIESLFVCNVANSASKETYKQQVLPLPKQGNSVLDPKKSQNIAILLRALNITKEEVCDALLEGNTENLGSELLETLLKMAPSKEEERKLREWNDDSPVKLGPAEKFLNALLDIPLAFKRVDAMLYIINFDSEVNYLKQSFETLEMACEELRSSRLFLKLLEAVLKTGNRMNVGTNRGDAHAFKLDTLLKLVDVKGTDGKTTLLHFVVQEIIRAEGSRLSASSPSSVKTQENALQDDLKCRMLGLKVVAGLGGELSNVKKAASMDSEVLSSYVSKLAGGISKISEVLRLIEEYSSRDGSHLRFHEAISKFMKKADDGIIKVQAQESVALSLVKEITEYFHGNSAMEEAHPFRIFMVVRDFLCFLDQVCKEVGRITDRTIASSVRQFPVPVNPTLPSLFPKLRALRPESSDDESLASSISS